MLTFGQRLYEMLSAAPLRDAELASWRAAETLGVRFPGPPPRGRREQRIFLPAAGAAPARRSPTSSPTLLVARAVVDSPAAPPTAPAGTFPLSDAAGA